MIIWRDIKTEQPSPHERVLVYFPEKSERGNYIEIGFYDGENLISNNTASSVNAWYHGTHWTPLPEFPVTLRIYK